MILQSVAMGRSGCLPFVATSWSHGADMEQRACGCLVHLLPFEIVSVLCKRTFCTSEHAHPYRTCMPYGPNARDFEFCHNSTLYPRNKIFMVMTLCFWHACFGEYRPKSPLGLFTCSKPAAISHSMLFRQRGAFTKGKVGRGSKSRGNSIDNGVVLARKGGGARGVYGGKACAHGVWEVYALSLTVADVEGAAPPMPHHSPRH